MRFWTGLNEVWDRPSRFCLGDTVRQNKTTDEVRDNSVTLEKSHVLGTVNALRSEVKAVLWVVCVDESHLLLLRKISTCRSSILGTRNKKEKGTRTTEIRV